MESTAGGTRIDSATTVSATARNRTGCSRIAPPTPRITRTPLGSLRLSGRIDRVRPLRAHHRMVAGARDRWQAGAVKTRSWWPVLTALVAIGAVTPHGKHTAKPGPLFAQTPAGLPDAP